MKSFLIKTFLFGSLFLFSFHTLTYSQSLKNPPSNEVKIAEGIQAESGSINTKKQEIETDLKARRDSSYKIKLKLDSVKIALRDADIQRKKNRAELDAINAKKFQSDISNTERTNIRNNYSKFRDEGISLNKNIEYLKKEIAILETEKATIDKDIANKQMALSSMKSSSKAKSISTKTSIQRK